MQFTGTGVGAMKIVELVKGLLREIYLLAWQEIGWMGLRLYLSSEQRGAWAFDGRGIKPVAVSIRERTDERLPEFVRRGKGRPGAGR